MNDDLEVSPNRFNNKQKQRLTTKSSDDHKSRSIMSSKNTPSSNSANFNTLKRLSLTSRQSDFSSCSKKIRKPSERCESFGEKLQYTNTRPKHGYGYQARSPRAVPPVTNQQYVYNYNSMDPPKNVKTNHQSLREKYEYYRKQCGKVDPQSPIKSTTVGQEKRLNPVNAPVQNIAPLVCLEKACSGWQEASIRRTKLTHQGTLLCRPANGMSESFEIVLPRNFDNIIRKDDKICSVINRQCPMKLLCIPDAKLPSAPNASNGTTRDVPQSQRDFSKDMASSNMINNVFLDQLSSTKEVSTQASVSGNQEGNSSLDSDKTAVPNRRINFAVTDNEHHRRTGQEVVGFNHTNHSNKSTYSKLHKSTKRGDFNPNFSNNSAKCTTDRKQRSATPARYTGTIVHVEGDGRCLFRSLCVCVAPVLQTARRDEYGKLVR